MRTNSFPSSRLSKFLFWCGLLIAFAPAATAYTVVFRDGQRVQTPPVFTLSATTLTYEAAPGINRTVQLVLIDVGATERANNEAPGSFFKHAEESASSLPAIATRHAQHTLTNRDLEAIRQRRIDSEQNYEKRRIELGLPSLEETRRRQALEEQTTLDLVRRRAAAAADDEAFWRGRAGALRNEILAVDAEINFVRGRLVAGRQGPWINQGFVTSAPPFGTFGRRSTMGQPGAGRMGTMAAPAGTSGLTNLGSVPLRPSRPAGSFPRSGFVSSIPVFPFGYVDNSYDLGLRLNDLLQRRAGLDALWRELENEARIARAPQVWLAP
jgi:hypothetical protein